ncbi:hypothetical protein INR49_007380 [Caranx melampygus]|nr:hypothetical protein INR49_007380 [Caranx melampygus]
MATLAEQIIEATQSESNRRTSPGGRSHRSERDETTLPFRTPGWPPTWTRSTPNTLPAQVSPALTPPVVRRQGSKYVSTHRRGVLYLQAEAPPTLLCRVAEFLNASANGKMERDFALLTLTDGSRESCTRRRGSSRSLQEIQGSEVKGAAGHGCSRHPEVLQEYALYKKMTQAAILIQSKFRSYYEQKRFSRAGAPPSSSSSTTAATRSTRGSNRLHGGAPPAPRSRLVLDKETEDQAARKIMRFLRRCRHRIKELKQSRELERRG